MQFFKEHFTNFYHMNALENKDFFFIFPCLRMVENSKTSFIKLQNVSTNILNRYPTLTSSFCILFSNDDLWHGHFHIEFLMFVINIPKFIL